MRRQKDAAIGDGGDHGDELNGRYGDLLADSDGADGGRAPLGWWTQQAAGFAGKLYAALRAEAKVADVLVEAVWAHAQGELDGGYVAGVLKSLMNGDDSVVFALIVVNGAPVEGDGAALAVDHVVRLDDSEIE